MRSISSLGGPRLFVDSDSYEAKSIQHDVNDRCVRRCMGRNSSATKGDSSLADRMAGHVYELEGAESYPHVYSSFPKMAARAMCQDSVRQYDSPSLFEERRISSFRSSMVSLSMELPYDQEQEISLVPVQLKGKLNGLADLASRNRLISTE